MRRLVLAVVSLTLVGCAGGADDRSGLAADAATVLEPAPTAPVTEPAPVEPADVPVGEPAPARTGELPAPVADPAPPRPQALLAPIDPDHVLTAAVLVMTDGDLELALDAGLFTEAELLAAFDAVEHGTLAQYATD